MKTKKELSSWWCDLGNLYPNSGKNDLKDFYAKIDPCIAIEKQSFPNASTPQFILILTCKRWKHPITLWFFHETECVKISGF